MMQRKKCFFVLTICLYFVSPSQAAFHTNTIHSFSFSPPSRTIAVGDTVVWINLDAVGHTVTGDAAEEPICGSTTLYQGGMCMRTFYTSGTFTYRCDPYESTAGTIIVSPANIPPNIFYRLTDQWRFADEVASMHLIAVCASHVPPAPAFGQWRAVVHL